MNYALHARAQIALARVFENIDPEQAEQHRNSAYESANAVGHQTTEISPYFAGEPLLLDGHRAGVEENRLFENFSNEQREILHVETEFTSGSEAEWNALSAEVQATEWDRFHELCAQGIGDDMYFYRVLMNQWLVGYVGH